MSRTLAGVVVASLLVAGPAAASLAPGLGEGATTEREIIAPTDVSNSDTKGDCRALQCGLLDQRASSRAVALAAGAAPAATAYPLSMFPALNGSSGTAALSQAQTMNGRNASASLGGSAVEPALFSVIAPGSASTQLCIDSGNLLGLPSTCKPAIPPAKHCEIFSDDQNPACRPGIPEPGTLLLLGMGLLGLVVVRARATR